MKIYITILLTALTSAFTRISMFQTRSFLKTRSQLKSIEPFKNNSFVKLRSHFTILSTRVTDINILKKTLLDINKNFDLYQGPLLINGFNNKTIEVDLSIKQDNYYDIGFVLENDVYNLVTNLDFWNQTVSPTEFMDNLIKNYTINSIIESCKDQGYYTEHIINDMETDISEIVISRYDDLN